MKMIKSILIVVFAATVLAGCTKMEGVDRTEIGVKINGKTNEWYPEVYSGELIKLSELCSRNCDDAHIFEAHQTIVQINGDYAMPKSNDMDLTLGLSLKVTLNKDGSSKELQNRLKKVASKYKYQIRGGVRDNQIFRTTLDSIIRIDLSEGQIKSNVRPILEKFELGDAYYNIAKNGSIVRDIRTALEKHLKNIDSPLVILGVEVHKIAQPEEIMNKKKAEEALNSSERIHSRKLDMREKRMKREQLIRLRETLNELEILELNAQFMTPEVLSYKWIQTANTFAESGLPFAVTPEMLLPSIKELTNMSINTSTAKDKLKGRIKEMEKEVELEQDSSDEFSGES